VVGDGGTDGAVVGAGDGTAVASVAAAPGSAWAGEEGEGTGGLAAGRKTLQDEVGSRTEAHKHRLTITLRWTGSNMSIPLGHA